MATWLDIPVGRAWGFAVTSAGSLFVWFSCLVGWMVPPQNICPHPSPQSGCLFFLSCLTALLGPVAWGWIELVMGNILAMVLDLRGYDFSLCPLRMMVAMGFPFVFQFPSSFLFLICREVLSYNNLMKWSHGFTSLVCWYELYWLIFIKAIFIEQF